MILNDLISGYWCENLLFGLRCGYKVYTLLSLLLESIRLRFFKKYYLNCSTRLLISWAFFLSVLGIDYFALTSFTVYKYTASILVHIGLKEKLVELFDLKRRERKFIYLIGATSTKMNSSTSVEKTRILAKLQAKFDKYFSIETRQTNSLYDWLRVLTGQTRKSIILLNRLESLLNKLIFYVLGGKENALKVLLSKKYLYLKHSNIKQKTT